MKKVINDPEKLEIGDSFKCVYFNKKEDFEIIKSIIHNAGFKGGQCQINGLFVYYDDILDISKKPNCKDDSKTL